LDNIKEVAECSLFFVGREIVVCTAGGVGTSLLPQTWSKIKLDRKLRFLRQQDIAYLIVTALALPQIVQKIPTCPTPKYPLKPSPPYITLKAHIFIDINSNIFYLAVNC